MYHEKRAAGAKFLAFLLPNPLIFKGNSVLFVDVFGSKKLPKKNYRKSLLFGSLQNEKKRYGPDSETQENLACHGDIGPIVFPGLWRLGLTTK